jgi:Ran GTPase-activating protein (RanGAP) involved in mRNA processing and transport|tara:strand:- start:446 stop:799 length:354 start_codon:yes stop_codon:yes gene_type:complete
MNIDWILLSALAASLIVNGVFIWYTIKVLQKLSYMYDNAEALQTINKSFLEHINTIHEMEMFYGDETLGALIQHTKYVAEQYDNFNEIFVDLQRGIIQTIDEETQEGEDEDAKEEIG